MGKYLQVRKKSLPLHPHLRNKRSYKGLRFTIKEPNSDVKRMRFQKNAKFLKKDLEDSKITLIFAVLSHHKRCGFFKGSLNYWYILRERM